MLPALLLIISAVAYRIITGLAIISGTAGLSNFAPLSAIALCSAACFPRGYRFTVPLGALLASDVVLNWYYHAPLLEPLMISRYAAFVLVGCVGLHLRRQASLTKLLPAAVAGSCVFYLITNAVSWLTDPGYTKNASGLLQALTVGLPAYGTTPTWMFFRNSVLSDLFFTGLFVVCFRFGRRPTVSARPREPLPHTA